MNAYTPVHTRLCRYVQSVIWNDEDARDLISEITLQAYERFDTIQDKDRFVFFLFGIAQNLFLKRQRRKKFKGFWNEEKMLEVAGDRTAEEYTNRRELADLLNRLKPEQREAITLFEVAGFSYAEIAAIQHTSEGAVKSIIHRGRQRLKGFIAKEDLRMHETNKGTQLEMDGIV